ncbi:MAG: hypothetical protein U0V87_04935 [Acidobacteriota bacterium]
MTRIRATVGLLSLVSLLMLGCGGSGPTNPPATTDVVQPGATADENAKNDIPPGATSSALNNSAETLHTQSTPKPTSNTPKTESNTSESPKAESAPVAPVAPKIPKGMVLVPAGSEIQATLITPISTKDASEGTEVRAEVTGPIQLDGGVKAPIKRWRLVGVVSRLQKPQAKGDAPAELEITFNQLRNVVAEEKKDYTIRGVLSEIGGSSKKRNTGIMIGGAVAGAILGKKIGGDTKDAVLGAAAGAGIGAGVVRALPGQHIELAKDDALVVTLSEDAILPVAEDKQQ